MFENVTKDKMNEGEKAFLSSVESGIKEEIREATKGFATAESVESQQKEVSEALASVKASLEQMQTKAEESKVKTVSEVIAEKCKDYVHDGKLDVEGYFNSHKSLSFNIDTKAVGTVTVAGNVNAANLGVEIEPGIDRYPREWSPIREISSVGQVSAPTLIIAEYATGEGGAAWTAEGAAKPMMDGDLSQRTITVGKVAVYYKTTTELLADYPAFEAELRSDAIDQIGLKESYGILNGSGSGGEITGVTSSMPAYTMTGHAVATPNYWDAIYAAMAQINKNTYFNFKANGVLVNATDYATMMGTKDANGRPLWDSYKDQFSGVNIIPVSNNVVAVGSFIVGDFSKLQIRDREPLHVVIGRENDDLTKNLLTVVVEKRLMAFIKNQHINAFVADTFSNVITAITPSP